jgi:hypothetical protein
MNRQVRVPPILDALIEQLAQLRTRHPDQGRRPVHLLDMATTGDRLVTGVDCFSEGRARSRRCCRPPCCDAAQLTTISPWTRRTA